MTPPPRILYFNHEHPRPSGGVRAIYDHVSILYRNNLPAFVVHRTPNFKPAWFPDALPTLSYNDGLNLTSADVLVIPEDLPILQQLQSLAAKKVLFCQNHFYAFRTLPTHETWHSLGVTHVLCSSEIISNFVTQTLGWPAAPVVHCSIDLNLFRPAEKKLQIAYMPRKAPLAATFIRGVFETTHPNAAQIPWIEIENLPPPQVAQVLSQSAIFLSLSILEGLGLPPLEAMASGCVVVGYHGYGGLEFARPNNGFWAQEQNPTDAAEKLRHVVAMFQNNDPSLKSIIATAQQTAAQYTPQRQEQELVSYMRALLNEK